MPLRSTNVASAGNARERRIRRGSLFVCCLEVNVLMRPRRRWLQRQGASWWSRRGRMCRVRRILSVAGSASCAASSSAGRHRDWRAAVVRGHRVDGRRRAEAAFVGCRRRKEKGPLAVASGPSLGRKRPRRAAVRDAIACRTAIRYTATHNKQGDSKPRRISQPSVSFPQRSWPGSGSAPATRPIEICIYRGTLPSAADNGPEADRNCDR